MPSGMIDEVGPAIDLLNFGADCRRGRGSFGVGKFGTFHCNQWEVSCIVVWKYIWQWICRLGS